MNIAKQDEKGGVWRSNFLNRWKPLTMQLLINGYLWFFWMLHWNYTSYHFQLGYFQTSLEPIFQITVLIFMVFPSQTSFPWILLKNTRKLVKVRWWKGFDCQNEGLATFTKGFKHTQNFANKQPVSRKQPTCWKSSFTKRNPNSAHIPGSRLRFVETYLTSVFRLEAL